jgi:hypothetical protein
MLPLPLLYCLCYLLGRLQLQKIPKIATPDVSALYLFSTIRQETVVLIWRAKDIKVKAFSTSHS